MEKTCREGPVPSCCRLISTASRCEPGSRKAALSGILKQINGGLILFVDACYAANGLDTVDFLNETSSWTKVRVITYASHRTGPRHR